MAIPPGFLKFDGSKWIIDEDIEGQDGADGVSALIYRPGGVALGNVYISWTALMEKRDAITGPLTIVIDDSITTPALVDAGVWQLNKNTKIEGYRGPSILGSLPILQIQDGAQLQNPHEFENIRVISNNISIPSIIVSAPFTTLDINLKSSVFATDPSSSQPMILLTNFLVTHTFNLYGSSRFEKTSDTPIIQDTTDSSAIYTQINLFDSSVLDGYVLKIINNDDGNNLFVNIYSTAVVYSSDQPQTTSNSQWRSISDNDVSGYGAALGGNNEITGSGGFAIGFGNQSTGLGSFAAGFGCYATNEGSIALGEGAVSTAPLAVALGGGNASGFGAVALGFSPQASGQASIAMGGNDANASRDYQLSFGASLGPQYKLQTCKLLLRGTTTATGGSNIVNLNQLNGQELLLDNERAYAFKITILAARANGLTPGPGIFIHTLLVHTVSNVATIDFQVEERKSAPAAWSVAFSAPSGLTLRCTVTDSSGSGLGHNVGWTGTLEWTEMHHFSP